MQRKNNLKNTHIMNTIESLFPNRQELFLQLLAARGGASAWPVSLGIGTWNQLSVVERNASGVVRQMKLHVMLPLPGIKPYDLDTWKSTLATGADTDVRDLIANHVRNVPVDQTVAAALSGLAQNYPLPGWTIRAVRDNNVTLQFRGEFIEFEFVQDVNETDFQLVVALMAAFPVSPTAKTNANALITDRVARIALNF